MQIECRGASYLYEIPSHEWALADIDLTITQGEKIAIAGPAGSGKTTLIQMLDALILPTRGDILFDGVSVRRLTKTRKLTSLRRRIGVLFQFPEHQFFMETAYDELAFAARNFLGPDEAMIEQRAREILQKFQMEFDQLRHLSPFNLSSGEKRKLALASALMMSPEILILDEPTAGMDAAGRRELIRYISSFEHTTVILVTHNIEDFVGIVDRIIGISGGRKVIDVHRQSLMDHVDAMEAAGIDPPLVLKIQHWLKKEGIVLDTKSYEMESLIHSLKKLLEIL
jgi:energy-coupling factor transport system ATP-binding protein